MKFLNRSFATGLLYPRSQAFSQSSSTITITELLSSRRVAAISLSRVLVIPAALSTISNAVIHIAHLPCDVENIPIVVDGKKCAAHKFIGPAAVSAERGEKSSLPVERLYQEFASVILHIELSARLGHACNLSQQALFPGVVERNECDLACNPGQIEGPGVVDCGLDVERCDPAVGIFRTAITAAQPYRPRHHHSRGNPCKNSVIFHLSKR